MDFLQQAILLLTEPPGSVIYHLVTLFALQVVFALSYSRWRKDGDDDQAQRLMWASAAIFLARVLLLSIGLLFGRDPQQAAELLPPLEQAVNTATMAMLVWSLAPRPTKWPRFLDILLVIILVLTGVLFLFFVPEWKNQVSAGSIHYNSTTQAVVWTIMQIVILAAGLIYLLISSENREPLPAVIVTVLLLTAVVHLWNYPEFIPSGTNIPYWIRFGYLIAFPLWAVFAYQHVLTPLLASESTYKDAVSKFSSALDDAAEVIATRQRERRISKSLVMASHLLNAASVSIGFVDKRNPRRINFSSSLVKEVGSGIRQWAIDLSGHPTLNAAFIQDQTLELIPSGLGARQLHDFYSAFNIDPLGPLLVHPLKDNDLHIGLLVIAAVKEQEFWADDQKALMPGLAAYISQALLNSQLPAVQYSAVPPPATTRGVSQTVPSAILLDQVSLSSLKAERDELKLALNEAVERRKLAEEKALAIQKQARYLAAALRAAQESKQKQVVDQEGLETLITGTNESTGLSDETAES